MGRRITLARGTSGAARIGEGTVAGAAGGWPPVPEVGRLRLATGRPPPASEDGPEDAGSSAAGAATADAARGNARPTAMLTLGGWVTTGSGTEGVIISPAGRIESAGSAAGRRLICVGPR